MRDDDEILEEGWPAATSRDEMYERVTARGARLRATRRAVSGLLMVGSLLGAGAIGVGSINAFSGPSKERGDVPEVAAGADSIWTSTTRGPGDQIIGTDNPDGSSTTAPTVPGSTPGSTAPPLVTNPPTTRGTTSTSTSTPTSRPGGTTAPPTTSPTTVPVPEPPSGIDVPAIDIIRISADRLFSVGASGCGGGGTVATVSVAIRNATDVVLSWNNGSGPVAVAMTADGDVWTAQVGPIVSPPDGGNTMLTVKVTAHGPGGLNEMVHTLPVETCPAD